MAMRALHRKHRSWLQAFGAKRPLDAQALQSTGIVDDESYLRLESVLSNELRAIAGRFRFHFLNADGRHRDAAGIAAIAPPWVQAMLVVDLRGPKRLERALGEMGVVRVEDFARVEDSSLRMMPGIGMSMRIKMRQAIMEAIEGEIPAGSPRRDFDGLAHEAVTKAPASGRRFVGEMQLERIVPDQRINTSRKGRQRKVKAFREEWAGTWKRMDLRQKALLMSRIGWGGTASESAQHLAERFGISRQRIYQINKQTRAALLREHWMPRFLSEIEIAFECRARNEEALACSEWFAGVDKDWLSIVDSLLRVSTDAGLEAHRTIPMDVEESAWPVPDDLGYPEERVDGLTKLVRGAILQEGWMLLSDLMPILARAGHDVTVELLRRFGAKGGFRIEKDKIRLVRRMTGDPRMSSADRVFDDRPGLLGVDVLRDLQEANAHEGEELVRVIAGQGYGVRA